MWDYYCEDVMYNFGEIAMVYTCSYGTYMFDQLHISMKLNKSIAILCLSD